MDNTTDIIEFLDWSGFVPKKYQSSHYYLDNNTEVQLTRLLDDTDGFAPFIVLQLFQVNFAKMKEFGVQAEIVTDFSTPLCMKLKSLTSPPDVKYILKINELIVKAGRDFFSHCVEFDSEQKTADLTDFLVDCQSYFRKNYDENSLKSALITDTHLITKIFRSFPDKAYKKIDLNFDPMLCEISQKKMAHIQLDEITHASQYIKNEKILEDITFTEFDEEGAVDDSLFAFEQQDFNSKPTEIAYLHEKNNQDRLNRKAPLAHDQQPSVKDNNKHSDIEILIDEIEKLAPLDKVLTFGTLAHAKDEAILCFVEKLCLMYKHPKIFGKPVTEAIMWAAVISSSKMRKIITSQVSSGVDLLVTDSVMYVLKQVSQIVENRLYSSGDNENKSWFASGLIDSNRLKASQLVSRIISFIFQNECGEIALNIVRLNQLFELVRKIGGQSDTKKIIDRLNNNRLELSQACSKIRQHLDEHIFGQDEAKNALINAFRLTRNGTPSTKRGPVFLYGASGVGKTAVVKAFNNALNELYEDNFEFQIFNMEQFINEKDSSELLGSGHIYNGASLGLLTTPTEFIPNRVILFDEIEKAPQTVIQSLLSILSDRECKDRTTRRNIDFNQCIFVFTSNVAAANVITGQQASHYSLLVEKFSPEFINRIMQGSVCRCAPLEKNERLQLVHRTSQRLQERQKITFDPLLPNALALMSGDLSPRAIEGQASKLIALINSEEDKHILSSSLEDHSTHVQFSVSENSFDLDNLVTRMRNLKWRADYKISSKQNDSKILINISIPDATVEYQIEHRNCPFITIIESNQVSFDHIHGQERVIAALKTQVDKLNAIYTGEVSRGQIKHTLLFGPSGCGKTLLGMAISEYFKGTFLKVNGADLTIGDTEKNIKQLFDIASQYTPCIVFIENIETIAPNRKNTPPRINLSISTLQSAIDGLNRDRDNIWIVATTTAEDHLDDTLIRDDRISCKMHIAPPSRKELQQHISKFLINNKVSEHNVERIQHLSYVFEGVNYKNINNILENSLSKGGSFSSFYRMCVEKTLNETFGKINLEDDICDEHVSLVAYHEAGHAVATGLLFGWEKIIMIDIRKREKCQGFVINDIDSKNKLLKKRYIKNHIQIFLAGRAAELLTSNDEDELSSGAVSDITSATKLAYEAITRCGFSNNSSLVDHHVFKTSEYDVKVEVDEWLIYAHTSVSNLLKQHWDIVVAIASKLIKQETLFNDELLALIEQVKASPPHLKSDLH
ncbi:AAA family ATPase [Rheinheimera sp. UJ51]|uniref:AAA family ATPase n=1 Tax=Rheinheimera sp. UJ51 TaxID=2892446 RepID=UPI001E506021|nr:AAA family ATPase [Rheinheimera sp. UJ51]MCC5453131.1 AAA family ATPase [Rheinheimera sp. UJ51]